MMFAVHDWETTGLTMHPQADLEKQPRAIEFAGIITDGETIFDKLEFICNPQMDVEPIITKITGLTNEELRTKPPFTDFVGNLKAFFGSGDTVISHNLSFDRAILKTEAALIGECLADFQWPAIEVCSVEQTMAMFGRRMKLSELYELRFGQYQQKHRAMDDLMLLHMVCQEFGIYNAIKRTHGA